MDKLAFGVRDHLGLAEEKQDDRLLDRADRERLIVAVQDQDFAGKGWRGGMEIVVIEVGVAVTGNVAVVRALKMVESVRARTPLTSMVMLMLVVFSVIMRFPGLECYCPPF